MSGLDHKNWIYYLRFNVNDMVSLFLGGTVHMVCRNRERAEAAREEIVERSKNQVKFVVVSHQNSSDLSRHGHGLFLVVNMCPTWSM